MKKLSFKCQVELMKGIAANERRGNMNFSNADGGDMYVDESNLIGDDYDGYEYGAYGEYASPARKAPGQINAPQIVLSINLKNSTGTAASTIVHAEQDIYVALFGGTTATIPGTPSLNVTSATQNTPATAATLNVNVDGRFFQNDTNVSGADLTITGSPASYLQMLGDSLRSPFDISGIRIISSSQLQLQEYYTVLEKDIKEGYLFQYLQNVIVDENFRMRISGNSTLLYKVLGPENAGLASTTPNQVKITFNLYKQIETGRTLSGKNTVISVQRLRCQF